MRYAVLAVAVAAAAACSPGVDSLSAQTDHPVTTLLDRDGMLAGVGRDQAGRVCFTYRGTRQGGGACAVAGWAFETQLADAGPAQLLMVTFDARTAEVRVPTTDGPPLVVRPRYVHEADAHVAIVPVDAARLRLGGNAATAYDARGRLLGHEHDCTTRGGRPECGPWEGLIDAELKKRHDFAR